MGDSKSEFEKPKPYSIQLRIRKGNEGFEEKWLVVMAYNLVEAERQAYNKLCRCVSPAPSIKVLSSAPLGLQDDGVMG